MPLYPLFLLIRLKGEPDRPGIDQKVVLRMSLFAVYREIFGPVSLPFAAPAPVHLPELVRHT